MTARSRTPGEKMEACEFSAALGECAKLDAVVLGVSPDPAARCLPAALASPLSRAMCAVAVRICAADVSVRAARA